MGRRLRTDSDMTEGSIGRHLVEFAVPMAIGLLFQQLYNTVDTLVVGNFVSKEAQAAVGSTGSIINTVVGFCTGLATGASVIISQRYGAHDEEGLRKAVHTTIAVTFLLSVIATAVGIAIIDPMLRFMQTPEDVWEEARLYLTIYFWGVSGILFYNMGSGILRAVGDSRRPLLFLIFSALLNTVLDLIFVLVFGMKVDGVAWATILAQILSAVAILWTLTREKSAYGIRWREMRIDRESLSGILRIGLPSSIQSAITAFSNVFVQSYINAFGSACMAGYSIYSKLDAFVLIPVQALAMSSTTMVSQNWGADKKIRARESVSSAIRLSLISTVVLGVIAFVGGGFLRGSVHSDCDAILSDHLLQPDLRRRAAGYWGCHRAYGDHAGLLCGFPADLSLCDQIAEHRLRSRGPCLPHGLDSLLHSADGSIQKQPAFSRISAEAERLFSAAMWVHPERAGLNSSAEGGRKHEDCILQWKDLHRNDAAAAGLFRGERAVCAGWQRRGCARRACGRG